VDLAQYGRGATAELGLIGRATPNLLLARSMLFAPSARCAGPSSVRPCLPSVGRAQHHAPVCSKATRARRTGFYHGVGAPTVQGSGPSLCPGSMPPDFPRIQDFFLRDNSPATCDKNLATCTGHATHVPTSVSTVTNTATSPTPNPM
jgi:hypothetical protein